MLERFFKITTMNYKRLFFLIIFGAILITVLLNFVGISKFLNIISDIKPQFLFMAFIIFYFSFILRALRWKVILNSLKIKINLRYLFLNLLSGRFISLIVPARGGDLLRIYLLKKDKGVLLKKGLSTIMVERFLDLSVILFFSISSSIFVLTKITDWMNTLFFITIIILLFVFLFLVFSKRFERKITSLFRWEFYRTAVTFFFQMMGHTRLIMKDKFHFSLFLLISIFIWFSDVLLFYFIILSINYSVPFQYLIFIVFMIDLISSVPITPGALGQTELAAITVFSFLHIPKEISVTTILLVQFVVYWTFLLISGLTFYYLGLSKLIDKVNIKNIGRFINK